MPLQLKRNTPKCKRPKSAGIIISPLQPLLLTELLRSIVGARCGIADYHEVLSRSDYAVLMLTLEQPSMRVMVKLAGPRASLACPFDRTATLNHLVRGQTDIPTYEVLAADVSYARWPWRYLVTTVVPGMTWAEARRLLSPAALRDLYPELGRAVAALHGIPFTRFGEPDAIVTDPSPSQRDAQGDGSPGSGAEAPTGAHTAGLAQRVDYIEALVRRARSRIANPSHAELFVDLLRERRHLFAGVDGPGLCHEDLNPTNLLVREDNEGRWRLSGVLDFDSAWAGCPESDLARLELWEGMTGDGFFEAYRSTRAVAPGYAERRPLHQLQWCLEYASVSPQHLADTRRVCDELGIAPLHFAL